MKRFVVVLTLLVCFSAGFAQNFGVKILFEDALGNRDTISIGYDPYATDGLDSSFGETNLINTPIDPVFDVRISDEFKFRESNPNASGTFHTKAQFLREFCGAWRSAITLDIHGANWPVTATWDSTRFQDNCRIRSVFTAVHPLGWWDTGSISDLDRVYLRDHGSVTFTSNHDGASFNPAYSYVNDSSDTIPVFWIAFSDDIIPTGNVEVAPVAISIFPNPTTDFLELQYTTPSVTTESLQIYDLKGTVRDIRYSAERVDLRGLEAGIYFLRLQLSNGQTLTRKIQKQNSRD